MNLISLYDVSVAYNGTDVLTNVNMNVGADDFIGIIGPNGGGKTTLVKAMLHLIPYRGQIHYANGISIRDGSIGYLSQQNNFDRLFPISVQEVVLSGLQSHHRRFAGCGRLQHYKTKADELMELTGLNRLAYRPIGEISGGEMQKALLCRALISQPKLLVLDEPTNFMDNKFEKELYRILSTLSERMAIVMVSHDTANITSVVKSIVYVNGTVQSQELPNGIPNLTANT